MKYSRENMGGQFFGPFFVVAVDRSGTTLLSLMLDSHPEIAIPYESKFITDLYRDGSSDIDYTNRDEVNNLVEKILSSHYVSRWEIKLKIDDIDLESCIGYPELIWAIYSSYAQRRGKKIWGDKDPYYVPDVNIIYDLFPQAKFIFMVRDGRDVAMSIKERWWGANDFVNCIRYWEKMVLLSSKMLAMLPENFVCKLRYEDLVTNPEKEMRKLCAFLGVDYYGEMVSGFSKNAKSKVGSNRLQGLHSQLVEKPGEQHIAKWKRSLSKCDQAIAYEIAGQVLNEFGYEDGCRRHPLKPIRKIFHWIIEVYRRKFPRKIDR